MKNTIRRAIGWLLALALVFGSVIMPGNMGHYEAYATEDAEQLQPGQESNGENVPDEDVTEEPSDAEKKEEVPTDQKDPADAEPAESDSADAGNAGEGSTADGENTVPADAADAPADNPADEEEDEPEPVGPVDSDDSGDEAPAPVEEEEDSRIELTSVEIVDDTVPYIEGAVYEPALIFWLGEEQIELEPEEYIAWYNDSLALPSDPGTYIVTVMINEEYNTTYKVPDDYTLVAYSPLRFIIRGTKAEAPAPAAAQPAETVPAAEEPTETNPEQLAETEPAGDEPMESDPEQPTDTEPVGDEPAETDPEQPAETEPAGDEPMESDPEQPTDTEPAGNEPAETDPEQMAEPEDAGEEITDETPEQPADVASAAEGEGSDNDPAAETDDPAASLDETEQGEETEGSQENTENTAIIPQDDSSVAKVPANFNVSNDKNAVVSDDSSAVLDTTPKTDVANDSGKPVGGMRMMMAKGPTAPAPLQNGDGGTDGTRSAIVVYASINPAEVDFDGAQHEANLEFKFSDNTPVTLNKNVDYKVEYFRDGTQITQGFPIAENDYTVKVTLLTTEYVFENGTTAELNFRIKGVNTPTELTVALAKSEAYYTGSEQEPGLVFKNSNEATVSLNKGIDYTVSYGDSSALPKEPGQYTVSVTMVNNLYTIKSQPGTFTIKEKTPLIVVADSSEELHYTGAEQEPTLIFKDGDTQVTSGFSYSVEYQKGDAPVTKPKETGDYTATVTDFSSEQYTLSNTAVNFSILQTTLTVGFKDGKNEVNYTAEEQEPVLEFKNGDTVVSLVKGTDYSVKYNDSDDKPKDVNEYTVKVTMINTGYVLSEYDLTFSIVEAKPLTATLSPKQGTYNRAAWETSIAGTADAAGYLSVKSGDEAVAIDAYTVQYLQNGAPVSVINAGEYTVKVTGNTGTVYAGSVAEAVFTVEKAKITEATLSSTEERADLVTDWSTKIKLNNQDADGISLVVKAGDLVLEETEANDEILTSFSETPITAIGTYKVNWDLKEAAKNNYSIEETVSQSLDFKLVNVPIIASWSQEGSNKVTYDAEDWTDRIKNGIKVIEDNAEGTQEVVVDPENYTVTISDKNGEAVTEVLNIGTYTVTVAGNTETIYEGSSAKSLTFEVVPAVVDTVRITSDSVTYDRNDWAKRIQTNDGSETENLVISATAKGAEGTANEKDVNLTLSGADFVKLNFSSSEIINAGKYTISVVVSKNFSLSDELKVKDIEFEVLPAKVTEVKIDSATYDTENWKDRIFTHDSTHTATDGKVWVTAVAGGEEGTFNQNDVDLTLSGNDFGTLFFAEEKMIDTGDYDVTVAVSTNFSISEDLKKVTFTVVPAEVTEFDFKEGTAPVTYDENDWADRIELTAVAVGAKGTINESLKMTPTGLKTLEDGKKFFTLTFTQDGKEQKVVQDAGDYTVSAVFEGNYKNAESLKSAPVFTVVPAVIDSLTITEDYVIYDREDWVPRIYTNGTESTTGKIKIEAAAIGAEGTANREAVKLTLKGEDFEGLVFSTGTEKPVSADEIDEKAKITQIVNAGSEYLITVLFSDNYQIAAEKQTLGFTVAKATITAVTVSRNGAAVSREPVITTYDARNWVPRIGINTVAEDEHHPFTVSAKTDNGLELTDKEYELVFGEEMMLAGDYSFLAKLIDSSNFRFDISEAGLHADSEASMTIPFQVAPYAVDPITDVTSTVIGPSTEQVVKYGNSYLFGPNQADSARTLYFDVEPGEVIRVMIGNTFITGKANDSRFSNYDHAGEKSATLVMSISSSGVVSITGGSGTLTLPANAYTDIVLEYEDAKNLKKLDSTAMPDNAVVTVYFDSAEPDIRNAIPTFLNRDMAVTFTVPEAGTLDYIEFDGKVKLEPKTYNTAGTAYGPNYTDTLAVNWNIANDPNLLHSGKENIEMKFTDLVGNSATAKFDIGQSAGAPINLTIEPIVVSDQERIDMAGGITQVKITIEGTGYELMQVSLTPSNAPAATGTVTGDGEWAQMSTGEWYTVVDTSMLPNDSEITCKAMYDDLTGTEEFTFFFDDICDPLIMTIPEITEDNWVIPGIAERGSSISIYVDGEKITNRKQDNYVVFAGRKPQLEAGSQVRIVVTDLSNNTREYIKTVQPSPVDGVQTLDAYAAGKVFTNAHNNEGAPEWLMAGFYTEEELTNGVTVPLLAGVAFHIGKVNMKLVDGELDCKFDAPEGVTLSEEKVILKATNTKYPNMESIQDTSESDEKAADMIGYWAGVYVSATVPMELLQQSFLLDEAQEDTRSFYYNRQRMQPMPADE